MFAIKFIYNFTQNIIVHLMLLPILELPACVLGLLVGTVFVFLQSIFTREAFTILFFNSVMFYDVIFMGVLAKTVLTPFYIPRLFMIYLSVSDFKLSNWHELLGSFIAILVYIYVYAFIVDYFFIKYFKRTPAMFLSKEIIVDIDGYKMSKKQIIIRNLIKQFCIFLAPVLAYKKGRYFYYDIDAQDYIWSVKSDTKIITVAEFKEISEQEKSKTIMKIQKVHTNKKELFDLQYQEFKPKEITQEEENSNQEYISKYLEQKNANNFYNSLDDDFDINKYIKNKKDTLKNDFDLQYAKILEQENIEPFDGEELLEYNLKEVKEENNVKKTKAEILNENFQKQYKNF